MLYAVIVIFAVVAVAAAIIAQAARKAAASQQTPAPQTPLSVPAAPTGSNVSSAPANTSFPMPAPNIIAANGLAQVPAYVHRLMQAQKQAAVLMISSLDGQESLSVLRMSNGFMQIYLTADWPETSETHQKARDFFTRHGISPHDKRADDSRILSFPIAGSETEIANKAQETLTQIIGVDNSAGLKFTYEERDF